MYEEVHRPTFLYLIMQVHIGETVIGAWMIASIMSSNTLVWFQSHRMTLPKIERDIYSARVEDKADTYICG
jgi:hypothetical protein